MPRLKVVIFAIALLFTSACNLGEHAILPTETPTLAPTTTPIPTADATVNVPLNTPTITNTATTCATPVGWFAYTIQRGDILLNIAQQSGTTVDELVAMNCIANPNRVRAGDVIYVPNAFWMTPTPSP